MMKNKTQNNIPNEWQNSLFKNCKIAIVDGDRGKNYPKQDDFSPDNSCLFLNAGNVTKNGFNFDEKMFISRNKNELMGKGKLKRKDIVITTRGTIGNIAYYDDVIKFDNIRINSGMAIIRNENKSINARFLVKYLKSSNFKKEIKRVSFGSAQPQLTIQIINKFKFYFPPLPEQNAIVKILETWDKCLEKLLRKIEVKKNIKKGLMQRLLTGVVRLSGFSGEWRKIEFNKCLNVLKKPKGLKSQDYEVLGYPIIDQSDNKYISGYTNKLEYIYDYSSSKAVILFGDHSRTLKYINQKVAFGNDGIKLFQAKDGFNTKFMYFRLLIQKVPNTGYNRHFKYLKDEIFKLPELKEQTAIAKILTTADKKIEVLEKKKKIVEDQKKYLLNNLITGKIRIPG